jgi:carbon monoxide dehydrogenase subunit G
MATARRSRTIAADPRAVWAVVDDPHHMPRWWPGVMRMEGVDDDRFTQVFKTKKGRSVRVDFHLLASAGPDDEAEPFAQRTWEQEIPGTPFERVLSESVIDVLLEPEGTGTRVTIEQRQKLRGYSRTGGFMLRRATRAKLDEALAGLERICG